MSEKCSIPHWSWNANQNNEKLLSLIILANILKGECPFVGEQTVSNFSGGQQSNAYVNSKKIYAHFLTEVNFQGFFPLRKISPKDLSIR